LSLARHFLREFRPLFQMLEEPMTRSAMSRRSLLSDPFFRPTSVFGRPDVDVTEEGNSYVVEADLPGVKKENVEVRIGDGGKSLTIEGRVFSRRGDAREVKAEAAETDAAQITENTSNAVERFEQSEGPGTSLERASSFSQAFTRTVWLPHPVDGTNVTAKLNDGVLTISVPKAEDRASIRVPVE